MKFGTQLELYKIPEWASKYLDFLVLKKKIKRIARAQGAASKQGSFLSAAGSDPSTQDLLGPSALIEDWFEHFHREIHKISEFYCTKRLEFIRELEDICNYVLKNQDHTMLLKSDHFDPRVRLPSLLRAVQKSHRNLWCLEVYCEINYLGCVKYPLFRVLKKMKKFTNIEMKTTWDNVVTPSEFMKWKELQQYRQRIYQFVGKFCAHGDVEAAKSMIRQGDVTYSAKDVLLVSFCLGVAIASSVEIGLFFAIELDEVYLLLPSLPIFRLFLCVVFMMWMSALVLFVFEKYSINWPFIFEITTRTSISYMKIVRISSLFTALWFVAFLWQTFYIRYFSGVYEDLTSLITVMSFALIFLFPLDMLYYKVRKEILTTLYHIAISPFGKVEFRHFFVADVLTSMAKSFTDIFRSFCYLSTNAWLLHKQPICYGQNFWFCVISALPYWWRFAQCLNKFYYTKNWYPHLLNAGKYVSGLVVVLNSFYPVVEAEPYRTIIWVAVYVIATSYMLTWDLMMDWGLISIRSPLTLREKRTYPRNFYLFAMVTNTLLRFAWTITLVPVSFLENPFVEVELILFVLCLFEILRRAQWTLLRIENEKFSNIDKFRRVDFVPKLPRLIID